MLRARVQITCHNVHLAVPSRDRRLQDAVLFGTVLCISWEGCNLPTNPPRKAAIQRLVIGAGISFGQACQQLYHCSATDLSEALTMPC